MNTEFYTAKVNFVFFTEKPNIQISLLYNIQDMPKISAGDQMLKHKQPTKIHATVVASTL